jgi:hypothetical protein
MVGGGVAAMTGGAMCEVIVLAELQVVEQRMAAADMRVAVVGMAAAEVSGEPHN